MSAGLTLGETIGFPKILFYCVSPKKTPSKKNIFTHDIVVPPQREIHFPVSTYYFLVLDVFNMNM